MAQEFRRQHLLLLVRAADRGHCRQTYLTPQLLQGTSRLPPRLLAARVLSRGTTFRCVALFWPAASGWRLRALGCRWWPAWANERSRLVAVNLTFGAPPKRDFRAGPQRRLV